jgi:hypothetical protein
MSESVTAAKPSTLAKAHTLSITHKSSLLINKIPGGGDILQALPATPESGHSRFTVRLATEEATELGDPADSLVDASTQSAAQMVAG